MAAALGRDDDAQLYRQRYEAIKAAFGAAFVSADGTVRGDSQTAYILTITNDLIPAGLEDQVASQFVETLERREQPPVDRLPRRRRDLLPALTAIGRTDIAYKLLQNTRLPLVGLRDRQGRDHDLGALELDHARRQPSGPVEMNSFNHYAYGAVGEWMYRTIAGISALEPGYRKVLIAPQTGAGIDHVASSVDTPLRRGRVVLANGCRRARCSSTSPCPRTRPPRSGSRRRAAGRSPRAAGPRTSVKGIEFVRCAGGDAVFAVGSGEYAFAQNVTLGRLGDTRDAASATEDQLAALRKDGALTTSQAKTLDELAETFDDRADKTWDAFVDGEQGRDARRAHRGCRAQDAELDAGDHRIPRSGGRARNAHGRDRRLAPGDPRSRRRRSWPPRARRSSAHRSR